MSDLRDWIHERVAPGENLTRAQLAQLAVAVGHEPQFWSDRVRHDPNQRYFDQLYRDPNLDIWLICWLEAQDTGYHDHELSSGAVFVVEGALCEDYFHRDERGWISVRTRERAVGQVFDFDGSSIHGMRHAHASEPATSIHVYSPALWRMGYYEPSEGGLRRTTITYADELVTAEPLAR
ncbi:MAG: cysteine dioxygenase family protein [Actinobacteria bacterium]|nr:cysteine dioxygenase family protein [Actinomycetota bacterium]